MKEDRVLWTKLWCLSTVRYLLSKWKVNFRLGMYTRIHWNIGYGKLRKQGLMQTYLFIFVTFVKYTVIMTEDRCSLHHYHY